MNHPSNQVGEGGAAPTQPLQPEKVLSGYWLPCKDADPRAIALYRRHYSADLTKNHRYGFIGPAERMVLMTTDERALWAWRLVLPPEKRISKATRPDQRRIRKGLKPGERASSYFGDQEGVMCSIFRNEGPTLSSLLIKEAMELAWQRWPGMRLFTYVWDSRIKSKNPGYCFKVAGWSACGHNKDGRLSILEVFPPC